MYSMWVTCVRWVVDEINNKQLNMSEPMYILPILKDKKYK